MAFFSFTSVFLGPRQESSTLDSDFTATKPIIPGESSSLPHVCFSRGVGPVEFWMLEPVTESKRGKTVRRCFQDLLESSWRMLKFERIHRHVHPFSISFYFALRSSCHPGLTSLCTTSGNFLAHFLVDCVPSFKFSSPKLASVPPRMYRRTSARCWWKRWFKGSEFRIGFQYSN